MVPKIIVYTTETGSDVPCGTTLRQSLVGNAYSFAAPVLGGLYKYKVVYGTTTGGIDTPLATVSNLIGGDFDYKWYQQNFLNLSGAWKQNFPNIKNYSIYQVWPSSLRRHLGQRHAAHQWHCRT